MERFKVSAIIFLLAAGVGHLCTAAEGKEQEPQVIGDLISLKIGDGSDWCFTSGGWKQDSEGIITPPGQLDQQLAFYTARAYGDIEAEFEFRRDTWH